MTNAMLKEYLYSTEMKPPLLQPGNILFTFIGGSCIGVFPDRLFKKNHNDKEKQKV